MVGPLLAPEGWAYASLPPVEPGDPGSYHALFGRDSLIFGLQLLQSRPDVAKATLRALAALQGEVYDPEIDEEPGKIIHEYRPVAPRPLVEAGWPLRQGGIRYYGSADSTSWFLVLLAALDDVTLAGELSHARSAAGAWLEQALNRGGGLIRCGRRTAPGGLSQQGWRDALDPLEGHGEGILRPDGTTPDSPLADADSQAAAVAALRALARTDADNAGHWNGLRSELQRRISDVFGSTVLALEADNSPVLGVGSQLGSLLWADALDASASEEAARRLQQDDVLTPFGVRTLSSDHPQFNAHAYHRGSVWPFDNWLTWGGLRAAGHPAAAEKVRRGVLAAIRTLGRAPELYAVNENGDLEPISRANRVQAWTVGAAWALATDWDGRSF